MEKKFLNYTHLPPDLELWLTLSGSNYPCLEQISMVTKMLELLKFDCNNKTKRNRNGRKRTFGHARQQKTQISLRMRAVWS